MTLEYGDKSKPKPKKKGLPKIPKFKFDDIVKHVRLLSGGLSFGGGLLGCVYLIDLGIPTVGVGIFGVGVLVVHISYLKKEADKY